MNQKAHKVFAKFFKQIVGWVCLIVGVWIVVAEVLLVTAYYPDNVFAYALLVIMDSMAIAIGIYLYQKIHHIPIERLEEQLDQLAKLGSTKLLKSDEVDSETKKITHHINYVIQVSQKQISSLTRKVAEFESYTEKVKKKHQEMRYRNQELQVLHDIADRISYSLNIPSIVEVIAGSIGKVIPYTSISYVLLDENQLNFHIRLEASVNRAYIDEVKQKMINSLVGLTNSERIKKLDQDEVVTGSVVDKTQPSQVRSFFNGPLVIDGKTVGLLNVASTKEDNFTEREMSFLFTITKKVSTAVEQLRNILEEEKGKLSAMVASISDGLVMIDTKMQLMVVNPAFKIMLDLAIADVTIFDVFEKLAQTLDVRSRFDESLKLDKMIIAEEFFLGQLYLRPIFSPVRDMTGRKIGAVMLLQDVTKERELQRLREDFTSMMVHELRSPLDGIRKMAELIYKNKQVRDEKTISEFNKLIYKSSSHMLMLVNDLLDVAKIDAGKFQLHLEPTDIAYVINERFRFYEASAKNATITLNTQIDPSIPQGVQADPVRITQVLNNLISNALKFTPLGGQVFIQAFRHHYGHDILNEAQKAGIKWFRKENQKTLSEANDAVVIAVTDSGSGIAPNKIPQLFNKFTQFKTSATSENQKGTGLGLSIVKGIVEAHGGVVGVVSKEGKGSTFYFTIPIKTISRQ